MDSPAPGGSGCGSDRLSQDPGDAQPPIQFTSCRDDAAEAPAIAPARDSARDLRESLERLPNELLQPIADLLAPPAPATNRFALKTDGSGGWVLKDAAVQASEWAFGRRDLLALMQTSRRMAAVARPVLFRIVVIGNADTLFLFAKLLEQRPEIGQWVQDIACLVNLVGEVSNSELFRKWAEWEKLMGITESAPWADGLTHLDIILSRSTNLRNLTLALPDQDLASPFPDPTHDHNSLVIQSIMDLFRSNRRPEFTDIQLPIRRIMSSFGCLSSIGIYCNRELHTRSDTLSCVFSNYIVAHLDQLTNLRTLELCCDSLVDWPVSDLTSLPPAPHLRHLRLYGSRIREPHLVALCLACINLQSLVVHFEESSNDDTDRDQLPDGKTLNDALRGLAGTLTSLELIALDEGHYLTRGRERPRKPENHRLTCLPHLTKLEHLTIDYRGLFGTLGVLDYDDGDRLCRTVQQFPNLRDFTLVCEFGTRRDLQQTYLSNLDAVFYGLESICAGKVTGLAPLLRSITMSIDPWPLQTRFRFQHRFRRTLDLARKQCVMAGIKFGLCELYPRYADEDDPGEEEGDGDGAVGMGGADENAEAEDAREGADGDTAAEDLETGEDMGEEDDEDEEGDLSHLVLPDIADHDEDEEPELEEEDEASEYYYSGDEGDEADEERAARRPPTFAEFLRRLGENHGHNFEELYYAYYEDRWDEYLF